MVHLAGDNPHERALEEAEMMLSEGVDGIIVENYHGSVEDVRRTLLHLKDCGGILGLNILPNEFELAFELAQEFNASFIQLDYVAGKYNRASTFDIERFLKIKASHSSDIKVLGGIHPKYYEPVKGSILKDDIEEGMTLASAIVVTGSGTGSETPMQKIKEFRNIMGEYPLIIGAGLNPSNVVEQLSIADGGIVGSCFKPYGRTQEKIERSLVKEFMDEVKKIR